MKNIRSLLVVPAVLILAFGFAVPQVAADHGSGDSSSTSSDTNSSSNDSNVADSSSTDSQTASTDPSSSQDPTSSSTDTSMEMEMENTFHQRGDNMVSGMLQMHNEVHSNAQRTQNCQAAEHGLTAKLGNLQDNAAKHKALIDKIYSEALAYQQQNNLNPTGFTDLVNTANTDQTAASTSVGALGNLSVNLDCSSATVAANVATFKVAAQQARNDLLTYRKAVIAVLQALESAKQ